MIKEHPLKKYNFKDDHGHSIDRCTDYINMVSELAGTKAAEEADLEAQRMKGMYELASLLLDEHANEFTDKAYRYLEKVKEESYVAPLNTSDLY